MPVLILDFATLHYIHPIVVITFKRDTQLGFQEIRALIKGCEAVTGHKPYVVLSDIRAGVEVTPMGIKVAKDISEAPLHWGTAVLVNPKLIQLASNMLGSISTLPYPYKVFGERLAAIEWLKSVYNERWLTDHPENPMLGNTG